MKYKYLILFPIPKPYLKQIMDLMDIVALYTGTEPPYKNLIPHITFHRPIEGIEPEEIEDIVQSIVLQGKQTRIRINSIDSFGKEFIVIPAHGTVTVSELWIGILQTLRQHPQYFHGAFDNDNTLHITLAEKTSAVFDAIWSKICFLLTRGINIPLKKIAIYRKPIEQQGRWEVFKEYKFRKNKKAITA